MARGWPPPRKLRCIPFESMTQSQQVDHIRWAHGHPEAVGPVWADLHIDCHLAGHGEPHPHEKEVY